MPKKRREKSKYPALDKGVNLHSRRDYIDVEYVDGVYDDKGNELIRPLTDEEKKFYNDFYEETVITNFLHDPELKRLMVKKRGIINTKEVKDLVKELGKVRKKGDKEREEELKEIIKILKKRNEEENEDQIREIEEEMEELRQEHLLYPDKEDHKKFYNDNNSRNNCIYNRQKSRNLLKELDIGNINKVFYDKNALSTEDILIGQIEREIWEEEEERLKKVIEEELKQASKSKKNT